MWEKEDNPKRGVTGKRKGEEIQDGAESKVEEVSVEVGGVRKCKDSVSQDRL